MNYLTNLENAPIWVIAIFVIAQIWSLAWKGIALWKSAQLSHKRWFVILLLVNSLGVLDIIYIRFVARKFSVEITEGK